MNKQLLAARRLSRLRADEMAALNKHLPAARADEMAALNKQLLAMSAMTRDQTAAGCAPMRWLR
jgi:hypothetical protein